MRGSAADLAANRPRPAGRSAGAPRALTWVLAAWLVLTALPAQATSMQVVGDQIIMSGHTDLTDYERLKRLLDENDGRITTIVLRNRDGGDAKAALRMMYLIRTRGLRTVVSGPCGSACAYTFLSGVERHYAEEPRSRATVLGFHAMFDDAYLLKRDSVPHMTDLVVDYTGGKADRALFDRMIELTDRRDFLLFDHPERRAEPEGVSVFLCKGPPAGPRLNHYRSACEPIRDTDGFRLGLFTSRERIRINGASPHQATLQAEADRIIVSGEIGPGDDELLRSLLDRQGGTVTTIILRDSHNGDSETGDRMAALIRGRGLHTAVWGHCAAACARAFLGGVERRLTDGRPIGSTYVGLQGDYDDGGVLRADRHEALTRTLIAHTGGKATPAVLDRLRELRNLRGLLVFLDATRVKTYGGASVFLCRGPEARKVADCERIEGTDSYAQGIFTSPDILRVERAAATSR